MWLHVRYFDFSTHKQTLSHLFLDELWFQCLSDYRYL